jgi:hypothetical protein
VREGVVVGLRDWVGDTVVLGARVVAAGEGDTEKVAAVEGESAWLLESVRDKDTEVVGVDSMEMAMVELGVMVLPVRLGENVRRAVGLREKVGLGEDVKEAPC